jgi:hypothetical protein
MFCMEEGKWGDPSLFLAQRGVIFCLVRNRFLALYGTYVTTP